MLRASISLAEVPRERELIFEVITPDDIPDLVKDKYLQRSTMYTKQNK